MLIAIFAIAATSKITTENLKIGRKQAEDISVEFDNGSGATNPKITYSDSAAAFQFSNDGTNFFEFGSGSGSGEINYIDNWDFETDTSGWATYADAAGASPVDGTGGSPNISITSQDSTVLRGGKSLQLTKDGSDRQGEGFSYDFVIKEQDVNKKLKIQFDFKTNEDAAYANGDLTVWVYDVTNAQIITPVDTPIIAGQNIFQTSFVSTGSTSYRLIFHIATTNASAYDVYIDNVIVGPGMTSQGAAIGLWTAYTPTTQGLGTISGVNLYYRRVGDSLEISGYFTAGTVTASELQIGLPSGLTIGDPSGQTLVYGNLWRNASAPFYNIVMRGLQGESYLTGLYRFDGASNANVIAPSGQNANAMMGSELLNFRAGPIPISQWQGSGIVPMLSEDNLSEWTAYTPSNTQGFGAVSSNELQYRRVGDSIQIRGRFQTGTTTAVQAQLGLPPGLTIGGDSSRVHAGYLTRNANAAQDYTILSTQGDTYLTFGRRSSTTNGLTEEDGDNMAGSSEIVSISTYSIPIQEWAGSQNSLVGYSLANGNNAGLLPAVSNMSDGLATQLGHKQYDDSVVTITSDSGLTGFSVQRAVFVPYQVQDGSWRLKFNIRCPFTTTSVTTETFSISGVAFKSSYDQAVTGFFTGSTSSLFSNSVTQAGTDNIIVSRGSASNHSAVLISGDVELNAKPSWAL